MLPIGPYLVIASFPEQTPSQPYQPVFEIPLFHDLIVHVSMYGVNGKQLH